MKSSTMDIQNIFVFFSEHFGPSLFVIRVGLGKFKKFLNFKFKCIAFVNSNSLFYKIQIHRF